VLSSGLPVDFNANVVEHGGHAGGDQEVQNVESFSIGHQHKEAWCFRQPDYEIEFSSHNVAVLPCNSGAFIEADRFCILVSSEGIDEDVSERDKQNVGEECENGKEMEGVEEWEAPDQIDFCLDASKVLSLTNALKIVEIFLFENKWEKRQENGERQDDSED